VMLTDQPNTLSEFGMNHYGDGTPGWLVHYPTTDSIWGDKATIRTSYGLERETNEKYN